MRIAYCVICHKNNRILNEFIDILYRDNDIYVHVDKKANIEEFDSYKTKVEFIKERIEVNWGDFSQIQVMINLLEEVADKNYDYISIVSGDCLPVKSSDDIKEILSINYNKEFIGVQKNVEYSKIEKRLKYKYTKCHFKKNRNILTNIFIKIYDSFFIYFFKNKFYSKLPRLYKGSNWFTITGELVNYILIYVRENNFYIEAFKKSFCCDEIFFQTIVMNSSYKHNIYRINDNIDDNLMALRYIDWKSGPDYPRTLDSSDLNKIKSKNCIIGRKFSEELDFRLYEKTFNLKK